VDSWCFNWLVELKLVKVVSHKPNDLLEFNIEEVAKVNRPQVLDEGGQVILLYADYGAPFLRLRLALL